MIQLQKDWLASLSWEDVEALHQELCQGRQLGTESNSTTLAQARALWESSSQGSQTLFEALEVCRRCLALEPFTFLNANTMTAAARKLLEDGLAQLPPVEAQIIRTTVSHYVAGKIPKRELEQVLKHFEKAWMQTTTTMTVRTVAPQVMMAPRELPRPAT
jgi:hypothetical protein